MPTNLKRMTFVVTPEMGPMLDEMKKNFFYNRSQSDMIRVLVEAGLQALSAEEKAKEKLHKQSA